MGDVVNHYKEEDLTDYQKKILEWQGKGFDNRVHIRDPKSGKLLRQQLYRLVVSRDEGTYYVRDGVKYSESGARLSPELPEVKAQHDKKLSK